MVEGAKETAKESVQHPARKTRRDAQQGRGWYSWLARIGLVAKGVSFGIVGILALELAFGEGGKATSRQGALRTIADEPLGKALLVLLVLGFAAHAIWRFVQAFAEREDESNAKGEAKKWGKRAGYVGPGLIYAGLAVTTARLLSGSGGGGEESQNQQARETAATVFDWPGLGLYATKSALSLDFMPIMGIALLYGLVFSVINILVDVTYGALDPRVSRV